MTKAEHELYQRLAVLCREFADCERTMQTAWSFAEVRRHAAIIQRIVTTVQQSRCKPQLNAVS